MTQTAAAPYASRGLPTKSALVTLLTAAAAADTVTSTLEDQLQPQAHRSVPSYDWPKQKNASIEMFINLSD